MEDALTTAPAPVLAGLDPNHHHVTLKPSQSEYYDNGFLIPTEEELETLPKIAGTMPWTAYLLCGVEFAERASYYGCKQVFKNFIRGKLPEGGNGAGATARHGPLSQKTAGALGKGTVVASAMVDAFTFMAYAL